MNTLIAWSHVVSAAALVVIAAASVAQVSLDWREEFARRYRSQLRKLWRTTDRYVEDEP